MGLLQREGMTMNKYLVLLGSLALLGAGCAIPGMSSPTTAEKPADGKIAMCAQTPQVFFFNKTAFSPAELTQIRANVIDPLLAYYRTVPPDGEYQVVSIVIKRTTTGITVEATVDQPESDEPVSHGFLHERAKDGSYPMWYPEEVSPEYHG